jgi:hypothetical protein
MGELPAMHSEGAPAPAAPEAGAQAANAVFMVRPQRFAWNPETQASNRFQRADVTLTGVAAERARHEFDALVERLRSVGIAVHVGADRAPPACPDAVFPNNWVSFHADGTVVLYPMLARSRRLERRPELLSQLAAQGPYRIRRLLDLTHHELAGRYLEGTGSVVFDHVARVAFACLSPRTHVEPLAELCAELGYAPCTFTATDATGMAVYHTNVVLAIGTRFVVVARDMICAGDRERLLETLAHGGREVVPVDAAAVTRFAGNVLELRAADGSTVLAMSQQARDALPAPDLARLQQRVDRVVSAPIPTIETLGGGSVRCMLAEVFLPR